jgi:hypothetical protein
MKNIKYIVALLCGFSSVAVIGCSSGGSNGVETFPDKTLPSFNHVVYLPSSFESAVDAAKVELCNFDSTGITSCQDSGARTNSRAYGVIITNNHKFALINGGPDANICKIAPTSGLLYDCQSDVLPVEVGGVAFNKDDTVLFVNDFNGQAIYSCAFNPDFGTVSNCAKIYEDTTSTVLAYPGYRIVMTPNYDSLLINNGKGLTQCYIDGSNISGCAVVQPAEVTGGYGTGIGFNSYNTKVFVTHTATKISQCGYVNNLNVVGSCGSAFEVDTPPQELPNGYITDVSFSSYGFAFVSGANYTDPNSAQLFKCDVSSVSGLLTDCTPQALATFKYLEAAVVIND